MNQTELELADVRYELHLKGQEVDALVDELTDARRLVANLKEARDANLSLLTTLQGVVEDLRARVAELQSALREREGTDW